MPTNRKFPRILPQGKIAWIIAILFFIFCGYYFFFEYSHPPTFGPFYKEYTTISEMYRNATLGDRVRISLINPTVSNGGTITYNSPGAENVIFKIPQTASNPVRVQPGKNIVFCKINQKVGSTIICEIEDIQT